MAYDASLKEKWDWYNSLDYVQKEGFHRGLEKGLEQGLEEGLVQGLEKGRQEEKLEIALSMKKRGMKMQLISELLGLPLDQIKNL